MSILEVEKRSLNNNISTELHYETQLHYSEFVNRRSVFKRITPRYTKRYLNISLLTDQRMSILEVY